MAARRYRRIMKKKKKRGTNIQAYKRDYFQDLSAGVIPAVGTPRIVFWQTCCKEDL